MRSLFKNCVEDTHKALVLIGVHFLLIPFSTFSQLEEVKRVTKQLCSENLHGRGYVNGGDSLAADFLIEEFQKAGLRGVNGSYFQRFSFQVNTFPTNATFYAGSKKLIVGTDIIVDAESPSFNDTLRYRIVPATAIFDPTKIVGHLQEAIVGETINSIALDFRGMHKDSLKLVRNFKYELAQFIPVIVLTDEKFTWTVGKKQLAFPIFELQARLADTTPIIVQLDAVLNEKHTARNIVGYLPAAKKTDHTIVICAHYDHLGRLGTDTYFPGANDNASGTAMVVSLANHFKTNPSKYNLLFIAFAGEEAGILGSKFYVENPMLPLENIKFVINLDILGSGEEGITVVNGSIYPKHFELLSQINKEKNLLSAVKSRGYAANSDHYWFSDAGIPAFFIYTMGPNKHYHDPMDLYENLSFAKVNDLSQLIITFIQRKTTQKIKEAKVKD